jgi:ATP synthase protein I
MPPKLDNDLWATLGIYGAIGFQLAISVVLGVLAGRWLDARWGTTPWLTITGMLLGSGAGFWNLIRLLKWKDNPPS